MDRENVRGKIKGLLNMAKEGSGATDPERETAQRLADKLMKEHGFVLRKPAPERPSWEPSIDPFRGAAFDPLGGLTEETLRQSIDEILRGYVEKSKEQLLREKRELFRDILRGSR
jgi:hypothetical protein